ncbi:MAG: hypothetical protein HUJ66_06965, partial [Oscillospiraceae bacterium]|nr:hypothetical protein [Oscillospiraceae bacterium]
MADKIEMTAPVPAVGAAGEQPSQNSVTDIITGTNEEINSPEDDFEA